MRGRTVVVIAHRLSTVINATKIAVIENGQVAESGNHQELMGPSGRGIYRGLVMRQMNGRIGDKGTSSDVEAGGVIAAGTTVQLAGPAVGSRTAGDAVVTSVTSLVSIPPLEDADDPVRRSSGAGAAAAIPSKDMATSPPKQPVSRPVVQNLGGEPDEGSASSAANESTAGPGTPRAAIKKLFTKKSRK
ncbi:hypothetical protein HK105_206974 [Polyrhizophydium stewartii]|uniref:Uncharacterized protein n=1 Tax=Polyrhizophydium stewartii TaxID=2732419 RepID=A0ABR4N1Y1_9FUNG